MEFGFNFWLLYYPFPVLKDKNTLYYGKFKRTTNIFGAILCAV